MLISKKKRRKAALGIFLIFSLVIGSTLFFVNDLSYTDPNLTIMAKREKGASSPLDEVHDVQLTPFLTKSSSFRPLSIETLAEQIVIENVNTRPDSAFMPLLAMAKIVKNGKVCLLLRNTEKCI